MLAISFSRRDKKQASAILSDAIAIAAVLGCALACAMYFYAPPALRAINGQASAELVEPAISYVRWRWAHFQMQGLSMPTSKTCLRSAAHQAVQGMVHNPCKLSMDRTPIKDLLLRRCSEKSA